MNGEQTAVLVFPAEAADAGLARASRTQHRWLRHESGSALLGCLAANGEQRIVVYRFDESVPSVFSAARRARIFRDRDVLLASGRTVRSLMIERPEMRAAPWSNEHVGITKLPLASRCPPELGDWLAPR